MFSFTVVWFSSTKQIIQIFIYNLFFDKLLAISFSIRESKKFRFVTLKLSTNIKRIVKFLNSIFLFAGIDQELIIKFLKNSWILSFDQRFKSDFIVFHYFHIFSMLTLKLNNCVEFNFTKFITDQVISEYSKKNYYHYIIITNVNMKKIFTREEEGLWWGIFFCNNPAWYLSRCRFSEKTCSYIKLSQKLPQVHMIPQSVSYTRMSPFLQHSTS